ncbi:hypothetical protein ISS04_01085 [Candidatus Woesearchaeota archaeon]|nr:hypothetical protein [Candidatus Woesearchaeota archaeon]
MKLEIIKQEKQPLLSRIEIMAKITFQGATPSNENIKKAIATKLKADESFTVIKHIYTEFGLQEGDVEAFVYDDKKVMAVLEKKAKKQKEKEAKIAEKAKTAPAEQPKEEQPKEEQPKEEQPKEEQPKEEQPKEEQPKEEQPKEEKKDN